MRIKKPQHASLDEVKISREKDGAVIEFADPTISTTHFKVGWQVHQMSDQEILNMFNDMISARDQLAANYENIVIEIPPGQPQIKYSDQSCQWIPRGDVLRCYIEDGGPDGEVTVYIDDQELSLGEFGRLLVTHAGWGMRIAFVPEDLVEEEPEIEVHELRDGER
tara:strand:+ start:659 stop:1153 length:495 start_codon:yes stop_codon:yes gene_type:complete